jgi:hypothetical protein
MLRSCVRYDRKVCPVSSEAKRGLRSSKDAREGLVAAAAQSNHSAQVLPTVPSFPLT